MENSECGINLNLNLNPVDVCRETKPDTEGGVREIRRRMRDLIKKIQDFTTQFPGLHTEEKLLLFEEREVKALDWEVRNFLKTVRELEEAGEPRNLGEGVGAGFKSLVRQCKARGDEIFKSKGRTSKPTTIQLGKSSRSSATRRSKLTSSLISEIIDDELELAQLQADAEVDEMERQAAIDRAERQADMARDEMERQAAMARDEMERQAAIDRARDKAKVFKKQAQIQAKIRKQQSLASNYSEQSSKRSSRHSKSSKLSTFRKELDRRLGLGSGEIKKEVPSTTAFAPGITVGVATVQTDTQKISNWARERTTRNVEAFGAADIPETSHFAKAVDEVQMRSKVSDRMSQERYRDIPCPPGYEHFIPSSIKINRGNQK